ncbi:MAG: hypothetical protein IJX17_02895 [Clostridia bacterium]|nr:hypothetical protein [Clostridia bacterium]
MAKRLDVDENYFKGEVVEDQPISFFLNEGEKVLWKSRPKKAAYVLGKSLALMPIGIIWGLIDFGILFAIFVTGDTPLEMLFFIVPFFALHLTPFWIWLFSLFKSAKEQKTIEYVITDYRVLLFKGCPKFVDVSINLSDLTDATLKINFIDKILKVGDIKVIGLDGKEIMISDIPNSVFLHSKILALCKGTEEFVTEFYEDRIECAHCDTMYDAKESRCPSCGSTRKE